MGDALLSAGARLVRTASFRDSIFFTGIRLGPTANFRDFITAIYTNFQIITGDEWMDIMMDCSVGIPSCTEKFT